ncbi:MAG: D-amino acid aminotransferase, partial [Alphaproteobacteria bacterium]
EEAFSVTDAKAASEAFITSTTSFVKPVARIDGDDVGGGKPGPLVARLLDYYAAHMNSQVAE